MRNVDFEFFHASERSGVYHGEVLIREGEMILTIGKPPAANAYDIRGRANGAFFHGRQLEQPGVAPVTGVGIWEDTRRLLRATT
jgi:hypothetical protein